VCERKTKEKREHRDKRRGKFLRENEKSEREKEKRKLRAKE
jgi:hypothetical protein